MPHLKGEDIVSQIGRKRSDIPIIMLTGGFYLASSEEVMARGFRGFLLKPFTVKEAAELVRGVLDHTQSK